MEKTTATLNQRLAKNSSFRFSSRLSNLTLQTICALLIILWIYTGLNKLLNYEEFKFQLGRSPYLQDLSSSIAVSLPVGEIIVAGMLIFNKTRLLGLYASFFLMTMFTGYIYIMLNYSYYVPCSCGGVLAALSWRDHLIFNGIYTVLSVLGIVLQSRVMTGKSNI